MILEVKKWPPGGAGIVLRLKTWNFRYFLVYFDEFLPNFRWFLPIFCWSLPNFWWLLPNFRWLLPNFWWFLPILAKFSMIFGISCAHLGTVAQCSVDPQCASSAKTKHLETSQKLSETLKKNHETSRPISMNFYMHQNQKQSKCVHNNSNLSKKREYRFKSWKKGKPTAPSVPRRSPIQVLTRLNVA